MFEFEAEKKTMEDEILLVEQDDIVEQEIRSR